MRSTTRVFCVGETPPGSFQHLRKCALNAVRSSSVRLAARVASASNPKSGGAFGRLSRVGILAGSKIDGSVDCGWAGGGDGVGASEGADCVGCASAACWLLSGFVGCSGLGGGGLGCAGFGCGEAAALAPGQGAGFSAGRAQTSCLTSFFGSSFFGSSFFGSSFGASISSGRTNSTSTGRLDESNSRGVASSVSA